MPTVTIDGNKVTPNKKESPKVVTAGTSQKQEREDAFNSIGAIVQFGCILGGQLADAGAIGLHAPPIAHEAAELAETNEYIARFADILIQVGPAAALITAAMPLALQLLANHKIIPADKLGGANVVSPDILEAQIKTQMAKQAMEVIKAQQAAERELAEAQAEFEREMAARNGDKATASA